MPQDKAEAICELLRQGKSLRAICRREDMPTIGAVLFWAQKDEAFAEQYARAREIGLEVMADEILEIADESGSDTDEDGYANHEVVQRSKLRVDARKWILSKQLPRKYGERQQIEHSGGVVLNVTTGVPDADSD